MALNENWLMYDGDCPFCANYVKFLRLQEAMPSLRLIDARNGGPEFLYVVEQNIEVNEGMVLFLNGNLYHGSDCINALALMGTSSSWFNKANRVVFSSRKLSNIFYPILKRARLITLKLLGRDLINPADINN